AFPPQQFRGTKAIPWSIRGVFPRWIADLGGKPGKSPPQHLVRDRSAGAVAHDVDVGEHPAIAVVGCPARTQLDALIRDHRLQRLERRAAGDVSRLRAFPDFAWTRRQRRLDAGKADVAPVVEDEAAAVHDRADL